MRPLNNDQLAYVRALAVAPRLAVELRASLSLPTRSLSYLYAGALLQVDKTGTFTNDKAALLCGLSGRDSRTTVNNLANSGYVVRVGGRQYFKSQRWALSTSGWQVVKEAARRVAGLLSPLSVDKAE